MKKHLNIDIATLPEEGKTFSGELDPAIFMLPDTDTKPTGPLLYDLYVQHFDTELLVRGDISAPMEFTCVRTLTPFTQTLKTNDLCLSIEISGGVVDLADALREEIILLFPDYPRCDEGDVPMECILDSRYLAVDNPPHDDVKTPPASEEPNPWAALDAINDEPSGEADQPH
jgi:uncharacterized protein